MPKSRKSNKEAKKQPAMTMKEKRAAKKSKAEEKNVMGSESAARRPINVSAAKRPRVQGAR